jgi:hypothetical protein
MTDAAALPTDPDLDGLALMQRDATRAGERTGRIERSFAIGHHVARLRFAGPALVEPLTRAIAHLSVEGAPTGGTDLTVDVWDSDTTGVPLSPLLRALVDSLHGNPFALLSSRQEIVALSNDRVAATFELGSGVLTLFDRERNHAIYWVRNVVELPYYERGAPFRTTLNWWLSQKGIQCVHAAAVGTPEAALLLTGKGGSGKSTTALACIGTPLSYIGDDYCAISTNDGPEVFSLYNTGKFRDDADVRRQPRFEPWIVNPERSGDEKYLMYLAESAPDQLLTRAPLAAIVLPHVTGETKPRLEQVGSAAALKALAPTSIFQLPGAASNAFVQMAALAKSLPCYSLACGTDLAATTDVLAELVGRLAGAAS